MSLDGCSGSLVTNLVSPMTDHRVVGHMVVRNESRRLLEASLNWNVPFLDMFHVFDDRSTDDTLNKVLKYTEHVGVRSESQTSFADNESEFRQAAWDNLVEVCDLQENDWVLCLDADEFYVGNDKQSPREALDATIQTCENAGLLAAWIKRVVVWETDITPMVRVDGFWNKDSQIRLVRFKPKGKIPAGKLGCGSVPSYAKKSVIKNVVYGRIMDFGYSLPGEPERKHEFYKARNDKHSSAHIDSIISEPQLMEWKGDVPKL